MDSQVNTSVANDVDFLEFRFGETIRQKCLSSRKFHRFFGRLLAQTFGTFVARFRDFIAQNCPLVGKSMNEGALKVLFYCFRSTIHKMGSSIQIIAGLFNEFVA